MALPDRDECDLLLHFSTVISTLSDRTTTLTQRLGLMEQRLLLELEGEHTRAPQLRDVSRPVPISGPSSRRR